VSLSAGLMCWTVLTASCGVYLKEACCAVGRGLTGCVAKPTSMLLWAATVLRTYVPVLLIKSSCR
jgi:hypothetical protein